MKRILSLFLIVLMILPLAGCKSAEVKNLEALIASIGEAELSDGSVILAARQAYGALPLDERKDVENSAALAAAWDSYLALYIADVGDWSHRHVEYWHLAEILSRPDITFSPDGTYIAQQETVGGIGFLSGTWRVEEELLYLTGSSGETVSWAIFEEDGAIRLAGCIPMEERDAEIAAHFLVVDMSEADPADYFDFYLYEEQELDRFGDPTGNSHTYLLLKNLLLEDGWRCYAAEDFLLEIIMPGGTALYTESDGTETRHVFESYTCILDSTNPPHSYSLISVGSVEDGFTRAHEFDMDAVSFGRMTGYLLFVHESYIESAFEEDGWLMFELRNRVQITSGRYYSDVKY